MNTENPLIGKSTKDSQSITKDWQFVNTKEIEGVKVQEVINVPTSYGYLTELYRESWFEEQDNVQIGQVFQSLLEAGGISAWHMHKDTTDRLFVNVGRMKVVLYDGRLGSSSYGHVAQFIVGNIRPTLVVIPPGVWHGIQNISNEIACIINMVDVAYRYHDPDHYRLPEDTPEIPYTF